MRTRARQCRERHCPLATERSWAAVLAHTHINRTDPPHSTESPAEREVKARAALRSQRGFRLAAEDALVRVLVPQADVLAPHDAQALGGLLQAEVVGLGDHALHRAPERAREL